MAFSGLSISSPGVTRGESDLTLFAITHGQGKFVALGMPGDAYYATNITEWLPGRPPHPRLNLILLRPLGVNPGCSSPTVSSPIAAGNPLPDCPTASRGRPLVKRRAWGDLLRCKLPERVMPGSVSWCHARAQASRSHGVQLLTDARNPCAAGGRRSAPLVMPLNSNQPKELTLHPLKRLWVSMLKITERLPEPKCTRASQRAKDHRHRIELPPAAKVVYRGARK